jgi:hypothetical protein
MHNDHEVTSRPYQDPQRIFAITEHRLPPSDEAQRGWGRSYREAYRWCQYFAEKYEWDEPNEEQARFWHEKADEYTTRLSWEEQYGSRGHVSDPAIENELDRRGLVEEIQVCYKHQYVDRLKVRF